ncbi:MAG: YceD family protein [bacterium]|nr:YceD family protein [bacterium]
MSNPLIVPVAEVLRRPGSRRELFIEADVEGLATSDAAVLGPVNLRLHLESAVGGLEVTGSLSAEWRGSCRRCLAAIEQSVDLDLREMFSSTPLDEEVYAINDGEADFTPMVRDCLVLALPIAPLCSDDCAGPAPDAYPVNQPEPAAEDRPRDPRWAALDELRAGQ